MARVRRAGILLVVLVVALGIGGAVAGAKKKHKKKGWASQITLTHPATNQFAGKVDSKLKGCRGSRVVTLFYTDPYTAQTSPVSVQRTDGKGRYGVVLPKDAFFGTYQAQVAQRKIRALKSKQTCKAAQSATIVLQ